MFGLYEYLTSWMKLGTLSPDAQEVGEPSQGLYARSTENSAQAPQDDANPHHPQPHHHVVRPKQQAAQEPRLHSV